MWVVCGLISLVGGGTESGGCVGVTCAFATPTAEARETVTAAGEAAAEASYAADENGDDDDGGDDYADYYRPPAAGSVGVKKGLRGNLLAVNLRHAFSPWV